MSNNKNGYYDFIAKILIVGDSGVGKTCLLLRFCDNTFTTSHLATIGIDFKIKQLEVDGKKIKMQIWDTAGQDRFRSITQTYYKGAMGIILTYACNDKESFQNVGNWMKQIHEQSNEGVSVVLVGNKADMQNRVVTKEEGQALADSYNIKFFETSAKEDLGVKDAFFTIAKEIKDKIQTKEIVPQPTPGGNLLPSNNQNTKKDSKCC